MKKTLEFENHSGARHMIVTAPDEDREIQVVICDKIQGMSFWIREDQAAQLSEFISRHYPATVK